MKKTIIFFYIILISFTFYGQNKKPKIVAYFNAERNSITNAGSICFDDKNPFIDIVVISDAKINYSRGLKEYSLQLSPNIQFVLRSYQKTIKPLQEKGIKVLLSISGNNQGVGLGNFINRESASKFAEKLSKTLDLYGLDGIELNDEFTNYNQFGTGAPSKDSFIYLLEELKAALPEKIISFNNYFTNRKYLKAVKNISNLIDYSWKPNFSKSKVSSELGLPKDRLGFSPVDISLASNSKVLDIVKNTKEKELGVFVMKKLSFPKCLKIFNKISKEFYDKEVFLTGKVYRNNKDLIGK